MKTIVRFALVSSLISAAACSNQTSHDVPGARITTAAAEPTVAHPPHSAVERGAYLVSVGGCNDCHTPMAMGPNGPGPDKTRLLSGHPAPAVMPLAPPPSGPWMVAIAGTGTAYAGPWGTTFTANLTPDKETGLGTWTAQNFIDTIRNGRHLGAGRPLLPPMPTENYAKMTDEDLTAIFSYLQSIPAVANKVPSPIAPPTAEAHPAPSTTSPT